MIHKTDRLLAPAVTDQAGRFVLLLARRLGAGLRASHPRYVGPGIGAEADSRVLEPLILEPGGGIAGTVIDAATGRPVAGVIVGAQLVEHRTRILGGYGEARQRQTGPVPHRRAWSRGSTTSCSGGCPAMTSHGAGRGVRLRVRAGADDARRPGRHRGRPLRGVVIDRDTGQPVPGIRVGCYGPARPRSGAGVESHKTDDQGRFTFHVPPGEQHVYCMDGLLDSRLDRRDRRRPRARRDRARPAAEDQRPESLGPRVDMMKAAVAPAAGRGEGAKDVEESRGEGRERRRSARSGEPARAKADPEAAEGRRPRRSARSPATCAIRKAGRWPASSVQVDPRASGAPRRRSSSSTSRRPTAMACSSSRTCRAGRSRSR